MSSRLALGTVQFGMPYGVANRAGQVSASEVRRILQAGRDGGMDTLDTAVGYGTSEEVLGAAGVRSWRVVTKIGRPPAGCEDVSKWCMQEIEGSLRRLRVDTLAAVLIHDPAILDEPAGVRLFSGLHTAKARGLTEKIGYSIYAPDVLGRRYAELRPDLLQAPLNVFDRRLETSGWLETLQRDGVEVHTRSAFLQGLLLIPPKERPEAFSRWNSHFAHWESWLAAEGTAPVAGALGYPLSLQGVAKVVVGVDSAGQLNAILEQCATKAPLPPAALATTDTDLIDPSQWRII